MNKNSLNNLRPFNKMQPSERKELSRRGGVASAENRRNQKQIRELLERLLALPTGQGKLYDINKIKSIKDFENKNIDVITAILLSLIMQAIKGNVRATELIFEILKTAPEERQQDEEEKEILEAFQIIVSTRKIEGVD